MRACAERLVRSVASCVCSLLPIAFVMENIAGVLLAPEAPNRSGRAVESRQSRAYSPPVGFHVWAHFSDFENS